MKSRLFAAWSLDEAFRLASALARKDEMNVKGHYHKEIDIPPDRLGGSVRLSPGPWAGRESGRGRAERQASGGALEAAVFHRHHRGRPTQYASGRPRLMPSPILIHGSVQRVLAAPEPRSAPRETPWPGRAAQEAKKPASQGNGLLQRTLPTVGEAVRQPRSQPPIFPIELAVEPGVSALPLKLRVAFPAHLNSTPGPPPVNGCPLVHLRASGSARGTPRAGRPGP